MTLLYSSFIFLGIFLIVHAKALEARAPATNLEGFLLTLGTPATLTQPIGIKSWNQKATPTLTTVVSISGAPQTVTLGPTDKPIPLLTVTKNNGAVVVCVQTTYSVAGPRTGCVSGWQKTIKSTSKSPKTHHPGHVKTATKDVKPTHTHHAEKPTKTASKGADTTDKGPAGSAPTKTHGAGGKATRDKTTHKKTKHGAATPTKGGAATKTPGSGPKGTKSKVTKHEGTKGAPTKTPGSGHKGTKSKATKHHGTKGATNKGTDGGTRPGKTPAPTAKATTKHPTKGHGTKGPGKTHTQNNAHHTTNSPDIFAHPSQSKTIITQSGITGTYSRQTFSEYATLKSTTTIKTHYPVTNTAGDTSETGFFIIVGPGGVYWEPVCGGALCPGGGIGLGGGLGSPPCLGFLCPPGGGGGGSDGGGDDDDPDKTKTNGHKKTEEKDTKTEEKHTSTEKEHTSTEAPSSTSSAAACLPRTTIWPLPSYVIASSFETSVKQTKNPKNTKQTKNTKQPDQTENTKQPDQTDGPKQPKHTTPAGGGGAGSGDSNGSTLPPPSKTQKEAATSSSKAAESTPTETTEYCQLWTDCKKTKKTCTDNETITCFASWEITEQDPGVCICTGTGS
ncbi:MAG: hypothetical protein Q9167_007618 [Letrouitia subvulpina]